MCLNSDQKSVLRMKKGLGETGSREQRRMSNPGQKKKRGTNKLTGKEAQELSSLTNKRKSKVCPTERFVYPLSMSAASKANSPALGLHFSKMCS